MVQVKKIIPIVLVIAALFLTKYGLEYFAPINKQKKLPIAAENITTKPYKIEIVAQNLYVPWSIVFPSNERVLFTERNGNIKEIVNNQTNILLTITGISETEEEGLMGLALDPDYENNKLMYASYAYPENGKLFVRIIKLKDNITNIETVETILDKIPAAKYHAGNRLRFGPDNKLYSSTGDATDKNSAQDLATLSGKILRLNTDGSIPEDNPIKGSYVYSYGHRNPQGFDWHPMYKYLIATEHGPSIIDGPAGGDEINLINPNKNYGWPIIHHDEKKDGLESPLLQFTPAIAPAEGVFYNSNVLPQFENDFFVAALKGEGIYHFKLDDKGNIKGYEKMADINYGRIREIAVNNKGEIYFSTSNTDGRGKVNENDDKIYKITPL